MDSTVEEVLSVAASILGDPFQDTWTNQQLYPFFAQIWGDMLRLGRQWRLPDIERDLYHVLPAYTNRLLPSALLADFNSPIELMERGNPSSVTVTGTTDATPVVVTTGSAHGRTTNDLVDLSQVNFRLDGPWYVTVLSPTTFSLNGSQALSTDGSLIYSSGYVLHSDEKFTAMRQVDELDQQPATSDRLLLWEWEDGQLWFPGATSARQLKIRYKSSGSAPEYGPLGVDDALDLLSNGTAMYACRGQDQLTMKQDLMRSVFGPGGEPNGRGGLLRTLMLPKLHTKQWIQGRPLPFRSHRRDPAAAAYL